jgi:hypothetical protein
MMQLNVFSGFSVGRFWLVFLGGVESAILAGFAARLTCVGPRAFFFVFLLVLGKSSRKIVLLIPHLMTYIIGEESINSTGFVDE